MKKNVRIGIIAYNLPRETEALVRSCVSEKYNVYIDLHLHSRKDQELRDVCQRLYADQGSIPLFGGTGNGYLNFCDWGKNRGLAASWNDTLVWGYDESNADCVLLVNDDIEFSPGDIDKIVDYALEHPDKYMITCQGWNDHPTVKERRGQGFSCFAVNRIGWETLGCFDENFRPIYFEDCDYGRRGYLAGLQMDEVKTTNVFHHGSLHWRYDPQAREQNGGPASNANLAYYKRKWGGGPGEETDNTPFDERTDDGFDTFGLRIDPSARHAPYGPDFDRTEEDFAEVIKL